MERCYWYIKCCIVSARRWQHAYNCHSAIGHWWEIIFFIIYQQSNWKLLLNGSAVENVRTYSITCSLVSFIFMCISLAEWEWVAIDWLGRGKISFSVSKWNCMGPDCNIWCVWRARESHRFIESHKRRVSQQAEYRWQQHSIRWSTSRIMWNCKHSCGKYTLLNHVRVPSAYTDKLKKMSDKTANDKSHTRAAILDRGDRLNFCSGVSHQ